MREILFKAKRIDNGEWVEGYLFETKDNSYIGYEGQFDDDLFLSPKNIFIPIIKNDTICQYTGLTDKNGQKIWENDILDCKDRVTVVKWHTPCGTWDSVFVRYKGELCSNGIQVVEWKYRAEVIGNIFDNPELLKDGD